MTTFGTILSSAAVSGDNLTVNVRDAVEGLLPGAGNASANTTTLQAALNDAIDTGLTGGISTGAVQLYMPVGEYYINDTITISEAFGLEWIFPGKASRLLWSGTSGKSMINMQDCRHCLISGGYFVATTALDRWLYIETATGGNMTPTLNRVIGSFVDGNSQMTDGVSIGGAGSSNNDFMRFDSVEISGFSGDAWRLFNTQSYNNILINCRVIGGGGNTGHGVYTGSAGGSFAWIGGGMSGLGAANFYVGRSYQPYIISFANLEASARLLIVHASTPYTSVHIEHCRFSELNLHADGRAIVGGGLNQGFLTIENSRIGDQTIASGNKVALEIEWDPVNTADSTLRIINTSIASTLADPFTGIDPTTTEGHWTWL